MIKRTQRARRAQWICCLAIVGLAGLRVYAALTEFRFQPVDLVSGDDFGCSVAITQISSNNPSEGGVYAAVGACRASLSDRGRVDVYRLFGDGPWQLDQTINAPFVETADFGRSVAMSGRTLVIGVPGRTVNGLAQAGRVYVYERSLTSWSQQDTFTADVPQAGGQFGYSVAIEGNQLIVGAPNQDPADADNLAEEGAAYVFTRAANVWSLEAWLDPSDGILTDDSLIGRSVDISGDHAAVGAPDAFGDGRVLTYERVNNSWELQNSLATVGAGGVDYGHSVALIDTTTLAVLLAGDPLGGSLASGAVAKWVKLPGGNWSGTTIGPLSGIDITDGDHYGESLAIDETKVIIGAPDHSAARGAAYVFTRDGTNLTFRAKLVASDATVNGNFGRRVSVFDHPGLVGSTTAVVGATGPGSVGAAFVFRPVSPTITSVTPTFGSTAGGTAVSIVGTGFDEGATVEFQGVDATGTQRLDDSHLTTVTPPNAADSAVVLVRNALGGIGALVNGFTFVAPSPSDGDVDGLPDSWETQWGLDPLDPNGPNGGGGDPDGDGVSNAGENTAGTHPRGFFTRYLAEGATGAFFDTYIALLNATAGPSALTLLHYLKNDGTVIPQVGVVPPLSRATIHMNGVAGLEDAEVSTVIESDAQLTVDRTMRWDASTSAYGGHSETAIITPSTTWYLAEGSTAGSFKLFYLVQNATDVDASVDVTFLRPAGSPPIVKNYVVAAHSRFNIWVNLADPELSSTDVSAQFTSTVPIIVERAMYLDSGGVLFGAGHEAAGVTAPALEWFLAEGATGSYFDLFTLLANVGSTDAQVTIKYLLPDGSTLFKNYVVTANSRFNVWVDLEDPLLANTAVSQTVTSTNGVPIVVERAMWWPGTSATWHEAHATVGATTTGTKWATAAGEAGGALNTQTYILIANTSGFAGAAKVTIVYETGVTEVRQFQLNPSSRFNVDVAFEFPASLGQRFGVIVETVDTGFNVPQLVVEHAMYWNVGSVIWAAGTSHLATSLPNP